MRGPHVRWANNYRCSRVLLSRNGKRPCLAHMGISDGGQEVTAQGVAQGDERQGHRGVLMRDARAIWPSSREWAGPPVGADRPLGFLR